MCKKRPMRWHGGVLPGKRNLASVPLSQVDVIAVGSATVVYEVQPLGLVTKVAVKCARVGDACHDAEVSVVRLFAAALLQLVKSCVLEDASVAPAQLTHLAPHPHPNVVALAGSPFAYGRQACVPLGLCTGSLRSVAASRQCTAAQHVRSLAADMGQAAEGLLHCQQLGVHRFSVRLSELLLCGDSVKVRRMSLVGAVVLRR